MVTRWWDAGEGGQGQWRIEEPAFVPTVAVTPIGASTGLQRPISEYTGATSVTTITPNIDTVIKTIARPEAPLRIERQDTRWRGKVPGSASAFPQTDEPPYPGDASILGYDALQGINIDAWFKAAERYNFGSFGGGPALQSGQQVATTGTFIYPSGSGDVVETPATIFFDEVSGRRRPHVWTRINVRNALAYQQFGQSGLAIMGARAMSPRRRFMAEWMATDPAASQILSLPNIHEIVPNQRRIRRRRGFSSTNFRSGFRRNGGSEAAFQRGLAAGQRRALPAPR